MIHMNRLLSIHSMPNRAGLYRYRYKNATITAIVMQLHSAEVYLQTSVNEHWGRVIEMLRNDHEMKISIVLSAARCYYGAACYSLSKQRLHTTTNRSLIRGREACSALVGKSNVYKHYVVPLPGLPGKDSQNFFEERISPSNSVSFILVRG